MTKKLIPLVCAAVALFAITPTVSLAQDQGPGPGGTGGPGGPGGPRGKHEELPLEKAMKDMGNSFKPLKAAISDPTKKDVALDLITKIKTAATTAKDLVPSKAKDIPDAKRAEWISDYKEAMEALIANFDKLAQAVKDGKTDVALATYGDIVTDMKDGHTTYRPRRGGPGGPGRGGPGGPGGPGGSHEPMPPAGAPSATPAASASPTPGM